MKGIIPEKTESGSAPTSQMLAGGLHWFNKISDVGGWNLDRSEQLLLLGGITEDQLLELQNFQDDTALTGLHEDVFKRLKLLHEIHQYSASIVGLDLATKYFCQPNKNPLFKSISMKEYLLQNNSMNGFFEVRDYLLDGIHTPYI